MKTYRADLPVWILSGGLTVLLWIVAIETPSTKVDSTTIAIITGISAYIIIWLSSYRITMTSTELIFRSLFRGKQSLRYSEIKKIRLAWKLWQSSKGPLRLIVEPYENSQKKELNINAKVFSRVAINAVLDLGTRIAEVDDGGLRDGIVLKILRDRKHHKK